MATQRFVSYAQNMEDVMLWRALHEAVGGLGFYIDIGASDPTVLSVTRAFYDRGWAGLNVEPLPEQAERLRQARRRDIVVQAAVSDREGPPMAFYRVIQARQTGLSTTDPAEAEHHRAGGAEVETIEVPVTTLAALCREHVEGPVHFLKVDVEGAEAAVLAGGDFEAFRPWIVVVESTLPLDATAADLSWEAPLVGARYRHVWSDGLNRFYLAEEHSELARHFTLPPNVFDEYTVYDAPLQEHVASLTSLVDRRGELIERLEADVARLSAAQPAPPPPAPPSPPVAGRVALKRLARRVAFACYRPFRPVLRPVVWRLRQFLVGPLHHEMHQQRLLLDEVIKRQMDTEMAERAAFLAAMERALLTLSLEGSRGSSLHLVAPEVQPQRGSDGLPNAEAGR